MMMNDDDREKEEQKRNCCEFCERGQEHPMYVFRVRSPSGEFARVLMSRAPHKQMDSIRGVNGSKKTMQIPHKVDRKSLMLDLIIGPFVDPHQAREFKIAWNNEPRRRSNKKTATRGSAPTRRMGLELFAEYKLEAVDVRVYCGVCSMGSECTCVT